MSEDFDFERAWLRKFASALDRTAGSETRKSVMEGSETLSDQSCRREVIDWSRRAMERLDSLVDEPDRRQIMLDCACQYPKVSLKAMRDAYAETGDLAVAHRMLQAQFETFLAETLGLGAEMIDEIVGWGWGAAGVVQGNTIVATKIPKSGNLVEYMREPDPARRRQLYCHCPRIRDMLKSSETISPTYCYCGAGFYRGIWEEITQGPVTVELLESVLAGDDVCKVAIHLPAPDNAHL